MAGRLEQAHKAVARLRQLNPCYVFPLLKTCWGLIGVAKTSRDTKKGCVRPGCPNDHRSQVLARGDEMINKSVDFRLWGTDLPTGSEDVRLAVSA